MGNSILNNNLSTLKIGGGQVGNFITSVNGATLTGGILNYTAIKGFRSDNVFNNYEAGRVGRYGYGTHLAHPNIYRTDSVRLRGNGMGLFSVEEASLTQDLIGDYYGIDGTETNAPKTFMTEQEFNTLGDVLRSRQFRWNYSESDMRTRYGQSLPPYSVEPYHTTFGDYAGFMLNDYFHSIYDRFINNKTLVQKDALFLEPLSRYDVVNKSVHQRYSHYDKDYGWLESINDDPTSQSSRLPKLGSMTLVEYTETVLTDSQMYPYSLIPKALQYDTNTAYTQTWTYQNPYLDGFVTSYKVARYDIDASDNGFDVETYTRKEFRKPMSSKSDDTVWVSSNRSYSYFDEQEGNEVDVDHRLAAGESNVSDGSNVGIVELDANQSQRTLLGKTNQLFKNGKISSLVNRFKTDHVDDFKDGTLYSSYSEYGLSRGRNLLKASSPTNINGYVNPYCRVWTSHYQYSKLKDMIRPFVSEDGEFTSVKAIQKRLEEKGLRPSKRGDHFSDNTVLMDNGFVRITPTHDGSGDGKAIKKYMFSLENLAWKGYAKSSLSNEQVGPNGGRIMWFPPYNLTFNENNSVDWNSNLFIGRGENIYTYKNTTRTGNLSFTLLIDHPSVINQWRGRSADIDEDSKNEMQAELLRFFAGCDFVDSDVNPAQDKQSVPDPNQDPLLDPDAQYDKYAYIVFYPNDYSGISKAKDINTVIEDLKQYEFTSDGAEFVDRDNPYKREILLEQNLINYSKFSLNTELGLNSGDTKSLVMSTLGLTDIEPDNVFAFETLLTNIDNMITDKVISNPDSELGEIEYDGYASSHGYVTNNQTLSDNRAKILRNIVNRVSTKVDENEITVTSEGHGQVQVEGLDINLFYPKITRSAVVIFKIKQKENTSPKTTTNSAQSNTGNNSSGEDLSGESGRLSATPAATFVNNAVMAIERRGESKTTNKGTNSDDYKYSNEYLYFATLKNTSPMVYKNIIDKIRYFEPAYHSMTPEGFNARLNFLNQCVRQGPTVGVNGNGNDSNFVGTASNLAFGRQPYCILRIGDFFNTKICITSLNIEYDNNGVQWDLNPEGAGVQPMMAKVTISFNFLGGQDIGGPVNDLQNAISENYYANSSLYNQQAKTVK